MENRYGVNHSMFGRFKSCGDGVIISPFANFYHPERIEIGDNVRIDDFCILSAGEGGIKIGSNIHIACYVHMVGKGQIRLDDYSQVGAKSSLHSSSDDFSGEYLVGPTNQKTNVTHKGVHLKKYVVLGCNVVVLPGVTFGENCAVGAMSLVKESLEPNAIYAGSPARFIKTRKHIDETLGNEIFTDQMNWHGRGGV